MDKKTQFRLCIVFAAIYFFSTNGMAQLPGLAVQYLLKDALKMTASQSSYFDAVTMLGWVVKPLWGLISDALPIFGYRRKSYLILTTFLAACIWLILGQANNYTTTLLLWMFTLSSFVYAFNDVVCDGLMVETGKPHNLTGKFQSWQWGAVFTAGIITSLAGAWVAENLKYQTVFTINTIFPLLVLFLVLFFVSENKSKNRAEQLRASLEALRETSRDKTLWLVAFFLFFWTFSPSFGKPFFYYANDVLKFDKMFFGIAGAVGCASSALCAIIFNKFCDKFMSKKVVYFLAVLGAISTLCDLIYFTPYILGDFHLARNIYLIRSAALGALGTFTLLTLLNLSAVICPKYSEGTTFAALTAIWNLGAVGSAALGGWLFDAIGLVPLIFVSAGFTALILPFVRLLQFPEQKTP